MKNKTKNTVQTPSPEALNLLFEPLGFSERIAALFSHFKEDEVLFTSSFGSNSALLLHMVSKVRPMQKVYFINTGFHFPETLEYKTWLSESMGLWVEEVMPAARMHEMSREGRFLETRPDTCCYLNKILPLEPLKARHKVWISGLMAHQTYFRSTLGIFERQGLKDSIIKFSPIIDMTEEQCREYKKQYQLPAHPLENHGYSSIGCTHCTAKSDGRNGRWQGKGKTECGLHLEPYPQS